MLEYLIVRAAVEAAIFAPQLVTTPIEMVAEATSQKLNEIKANIEQKVTKVKSNIKTTIVQSFDSALDQIANKLKH